MRFYRFDTEKEYERLELPDKIAMLVGMFCLMCEWIKIMMFDPASFVILNIVIGVYYYGLPELPE